MKHYYTQYQIKIIYKTLLITTFILPSFFMINACSNHMKNKFTNQTKSPYNFLNPDKVITLPNELREISGLSYDPNKNMLLTLNDEKGIIFYINCYSSNPIDHIIEFSKDGDYEGIEYLNNKIYCLKSNGTLISVSNDKNQTTKYFKTPFKSKNNTEGLGIDITKQNLLIACKGEDLEKSKHVKAIYAFNIDNKKLNKTPILKIHIKKIKEFIDHAYNGKKDAKALKKRIEEFAPSAVAINSDSKQTYILSARGSSMVIYSHQKEIVDVIFFNPKDIPQPEGICFDDKDNLYISTEGKKGDGKIFIYNKKSN